MPIDFKALFKPLERLFFRPYIYTFLYFMQFLHKYSTKYSPYFAMQISVPNHTCLKTVSCPLYTMRFICLTDISNSSARASNSTPSISLRFKIFLSRSEWICASIALHTVSLVYSITSSPYQFRDTYCIRDSHSQSNLFALVCVCEWFYGFSLSPSAP